MANRPSTTEMYPGPGNRIRTDIKRPPRALVEAIAQFESPDISDQLNRLYAMRPDIQNVVNDRAICGPACTVKLYPGDNLMVHAALDVAQPGDVIVVDTSSCESNAVIGDLVAQKSVHRGFAGYVIDGYARDLPMLQKVGLPIYARGITPVGPLHRGPGELNFPVACGGVVVNPGDIVTADHTGVVVVPLKFAAEVLRRLQNQAEHLATYVASVAAGDFSNSWVDQVIESIGCEKQLPEEI